MGLQVAVRRLVARGAYQGGTQFYFAADIRGGTFGTGRGVEMVGPVAPDAGTYTPVWLPIAALPRLPVCPAEVALLVVRSVDAGWPSVAVAVDRGT